MWIYQNTCFDTEVWGFKHEDNRAICVVLLWDSPTDKAEGRCPRRRPAAITGTKNWYPAYKVVFRNQVPGSVIKAIEKKAAKHNIEVY